VAAEAWTPVPLAGPDAVPAPPHGFAEAEFTEDEVPVDAAEDRINVEAMVESAYASGYEDGVTEGERMARERLDGAVRALEQAVAAWEAGNEEREALARDNLHALAVGVARHIVGRELKADAQAVADLVRRALSIFTVQESIRIRLNPADLSAISTATDGAVRIATGRKVEWSADTDLMSGDCVVEGDRRVVDGRVDRALERIYVALAND